ncbi:uncharacterized protein DUF3989 [Arcticibacter tournemirensis]|uniref:DUF3989 domain-containing protein n=1 Tax=Arcticibacter tournemirensis TaxID=699437 RepID=A0A5M9H3X3_9SPHI|nr:TraL conjugative transposon family protein [Arcticibacter tournemirensis]KAA8480077.1 DUF3989 domain-containing protein [Arcticibacter tournemirensis]TQM50679.1 uncharacterized protein DUF3989 [Arcticibacter tournemirensis]
MKAFRKPPLLLSESNERLAAVIAGRIISAERKIASCLNKTVARLPPKVRIAILGLLSLLFAAYNLYLLISSITY